MRKTILLIGCLVCAACQDSTAPRVCVTRVDSLYVFNGQVVPSYTTQTCQTVK